MFARFSHGNYADFMLCFGVNNDNDIFKNTNRYKALFMVFKPHVFEGKGRTLKDFVGISEVETMLIEVTLSLVFVPSKVHRLNIHIKMHISSQY